LPENLGKNNAQNAKTPLSDFWRRLERFLMRRQEQLTQLGEENLTGAESPV